MDKAPAAPAITGSDIDPQALERSRGNAAAAGVAEWLALEQGDVLARAAPATTGVLIANPPYGVRLHDEHALAAFYPRLGDALKQRFAGWNAFFLTGDARLAKLIGLKPSRRTPLWNGNIECRFYCFDIVAGRPRRSAPTEDAPPQ
jgi:putative N6-adenine-specific DNA methylase